MPRDRDAEERARKERRREAIRNQIREWKTKRETVETQIENLTTEQSNLNGYLGEWDAQKTIYNGNDILSEVVIVNLFEGVCANKIKEDFTACMAEMDQTYGKVSGLNGNVGAQISRLNDYLSFIDAKISALESELASI